MYSILLIEDNDSDIAIIQFLAKQLNCRLDVAKNPIDAHELVKRNHYHLLLLDWQLPHISGLEYLKSLKRDPKFHNLSVIMLSGRSELKDVRMAAKEGISDYIIKPVDPLIFKTKVTQNLQKLSGSGWALTPLPQNVSNRNGTISSAAELLAISEVEIEFVTANSLVKDFIYSVSFAYLTDADVGSLEVKVVNVAPFDETNSSFRVRAHLIGLREAQLQKIRLICRTMQTQGEAMHV